MQLLMLASLLLAADVGQGDPVLVADGFQFSEGPVYHATEGWLFSDIPDEVVYRKDKTVFRSDSGGANGLAVDAEGRVVFAEGVAGRVTRREADGSITVLADRYDGTRLSAPNDLVIHSDGTIYFTDPMPIRKSERVRDFSAVYAIRPDGELDLLTKDIAYPNGIGLSPDESTLYVASTTGRRIHSFDLTPNGLANGRKHAEVLLPDGFAVDTEGRIWAAVNGGIQIIAADGTLLEKIPVRPAPTNCAFGGEDGSTLLITARSSVFSLDTSTRSFASSVD